MNDVQTGMLCFNAQQNGHISTANIAHTCILRHKEKVASTKYFHPENIRCHLWISDVLKNMRVPQVIIFN